MTGEELVAAIQAVPGWQHKRVSVLTGRAGNGSVEECAADVIAQPDGDLAIVGESDV